MVDTVQIDKDKWKLISSFFEAEEKFYNEISNAATVLHNVMKQKGYENVIFTDDLIQMTGLDKSVLKTWMEEHKPKNKSLSGVKVKKGSALKSVKGM